MIFMIDDVVSAMFTLQLGTLVVMDSGIKIQAINQRLRLTR